MKKEIILSNYTSILHNADNYILQYTNSDKPKKEYLQIAIKEYTRLLDYIDITDYLLIDTENEFIPKNVYVESFYKLGTFYKTLAEINIGENNGQMNIEEETIFKKAIFCFITVLRVVFEHPMCVIQITSIYTQLTYYSQNNLVKALGFLQDALVFAPESSNLNYNLGFIYQKLNKLEQSITHYKLGIFTNQFTSDLNEQMENYINCYNGLSGIYRSIKQWPEGLFYLKKAHNKNTLEPNINNQLGIVYTEMRRTDLAKQHYQLAIEHYRKTIVKVDPETLLSEIYLNMGHMYSYNGDNNESINCYNKALKINPTFLLPFQNKIFNLCYMFNQLSSDYVYKQHLKINTLLSKRNIKPCVLTDYSNTKIHIGIVSGDLLDHPVSFFIKTFLNCYNQDLFDVYCYSDVIMDVSRLPKHINIKYFRHKSTQECCDLIQNDKIDILFDLSGHTAFNRVDVFASKPAKIQINYIGYPYTSGLHTMDYRITDSICDNEKISQANYTEKLLFLPNCFLCYWLPETLPQLSNIQPYTINKFITFGCFNRLNKINYSVISVYNHLLNEYDTCKIIFKTKGLINPVIKNEFLSQFTQNVQSRIILKDCTILHENHLNQYNDIDFALDTFPYSGTTTSCEALLMGVPTFTIPERIHWYHPQNVTSSLLQNSNLGFYICDNKENFIDKIKIIENKPNTFWENLKLNTRNSFINGNVTNKELYMKNLQNMLISLHP